MHSYTSLVQMARKWWEKMIISGRRFRAGKQKRIECRLCCPSFVWPNSANLTLTLIKGYFSRKWPTFFFHSPSKSILRPFPSLRLVLMSKTQCIYNKIYNLLSAIINMQQNTFNKQFKIDQMPRQRPLQKSMLLPESQMLPSSPNSRGNPLEFSAYTPMKKSLISTQENTVGAGSNITYSQNNFSFTPQQGNFQQNNAMGSTYESRISAQTQPGYQSYTLKSLLSPYKNDLKSEQSPEDHPRIYGKPGINPNESKQSQPSIPNPQSLIQQIILQLKDKHLPALLGKLKKQIYDDIHNIRLDFQALREFTISNIKRQDGLMNELKFNQGNIINYNNSVNNFGTGKQKNEKEDDVAELQTHYFLLENKLTQIQAKLSDNSKILTQEFQKINQRMENEFKSNPMKVSLIKSSLNPIMLEYKESFIVKKPTNLFRQRQEEEIVFNHCVYFIDKLGYLLDNENRYLVDSHGVQIRLEDKHIKILESHKILDK